MVSQMIPKECKRLAEVDFPIAVVSKHSAREKYAGKGYPSMLHMWWARRPLAACRAMLLGLLLPDPCDQNCPVDFKKKARNLLPRVAGTIGAKDKDLREVLLKFIGDFANWDNSSNQTFLDVGRGLVKAAHPEETPLVVDPFAGGGSIPLEALRLGCDAFASDLNPVACLILKVMLEDIPRHGPELAEELRRVGAEIKKKAEKELAEFYPKDPDGATPIAYLWARTVRCESPNCGAEIPLMRSFWLCKKASRRKALKHKVVRPKGKTPRVEFELFEPKNEKEVSGGTVARAKATCLCCGTVLSPDRVRAQLAEQRGGADVVFGDGQYECGGSVPLAHARGSDSNARGSDTNARGSERPIPIAYFITFTCYGAHLHGHESSSVDRDHNLPGTPFVPPDNKKRQREAELMDQPPYRLDGPRAAVALAAMKDTAAHRNWNLLAAHVRSNHVQLVIQALDSPEKVMNDLKSYASRALTRAGYETSERKRWTRHGSTRYLWRGSDVEGALNYVLHGQGEPMSVYEAKDPDIEAIVRQALEYAPLANAHGSEHDNHPSRDRKGARSEGAERIGGARMLAVVTLHPGIQGRNYRLPTEQDYKAVWKAQKRLKAILDEWERGGKKGLCPVPDEPTPAGGGSGAGRAFSVQKYGMM